MYLIHVGLDWFYPFSLGMQFGDRLSSSPLPVSIISGMNLAGNIEGNKSGVTQATDIPLWVNDNSLLYTIIYRFDTAPFTERFPPKGQWCGPLMSLLLWAWTIRWTNIWVPGYLNRHDAPLASMWCIGYDVFFWIWQRLKNDISNHSLKEMY